MPFVENFASGRSCLRIAPARPSSKAGVTTHKPRLFAVVCLYGLSRILASPETVFYWRASLIGSSTQRPSAPEPTRASVSNPWYVAAAEAPRKRKLARPGQPLTLLAFLTGTPNLAMSLSRSPSPVPGGGWSSPGLDINTSGRSSPARGGTLGNGNNVTWESARLKSQGVSGYPSFSTQNQGFFTRHMRQISSSLPTFTKHDDRYTEKEKMGRSSRWNIPLLGKLRTMMIRTSRKTKGRLMMVGIALLCYMLFWITRKSRYYIRDA